MARTAAPSCFTGFESGFQIYPFLSVTGGQETPQSASVRIRTSQGFSTSSALLTLPVISRWSDALLETAPCRYVGSAYQNDLIIAGHNYRGHFGSLHRLSPGDQIRFTDTAGNHFTYAVAQLQELPGTAIQEMEAGDWDLTLFTCTASGAARLTVRCTLTGEGG